MALLSSILRVFGRKAHSRGSPGAMKSRINTVERIAPDRVKKTAGPPFTRQNHVFDARALLRKEIAFLESLQPSAFFPRVLDSTEDSYTMNYGGEPVCRETLPTDWQGQAESILAALADRNIVHRDIKAQNLLVLDGRLMLIDFSWAYVSDEKPDPCPQDFTPGVAREMIYDNRAALYRTIERL